MSPRPGDSINLLKIDKPFIPAWVVSGKPFVTVTQNGPDDGGDFGPYTPGTQTSGIQEALNYAALIGAPVLIGPGTFPVSTAILLPAIGNGLFIRGASEHLTTIEQAPGYTGPIMQWANPNTPNTMYYFGYFRLYGHNGGGGSCLLYTSPSPRDGLLSRMPSSA